MHRDDPTRMPERKPPAPATDPAPAGGAGKQPRIGRLPRRNTLLSVVLTSLLVLTTFAAAPSSNSTLAQPAGLAAPPTPPAIAQADAPCVPDDPFDLSALADVISRDVPPSAPVEINRFLSVAFVGTGTLIEGTPEETPADPDQGEPNPAPEEPPVDEVDTRDLQFRVFNTRTLFEYELTLNGDMLRQIHQCRIDNGLTLASDGVADLTEVENLFRLYLPLVLGSARTTTNQAASAPDAAPRAWSNAIDSRNLLSGTTAWPWRTISQFRYSSASQDSGCTGTLVGPRHLVTAAHCINRRGTNTWFNFWVTPGKNGEGSAASNEPYGQSFIQINPPPGTEAWYFTHAPWRNPATSNPRQWDWGMIVIPNRLGSQTGWMGYVARPASQLNPLNHYNRGYPQCNNNRADNPPACNSSPANLAHLHGDSNNCSMGSYSAQGPDGWNRLITHSCDTSAGHSGSPVYHYFFDTSLNRWVPVVAMVHVASECQTCTLFDSHPSIARRHTPTELNVISFFRELFP